MMDTSKTTTSFKSNLPKQLISTSIEPSRPFISFPAQKLVSNDIDGYNHSNNKTDGSLPSYLTPPDRHHAEDADQISIFEAHSYFNEVTDEEPRMGKKDSSPVQMTIDLRQHTDISGLSRFSSVSSTSDGNSYFNTNYRVRSFHATPTASSEASWNSQTGLLANPPGAIAVSIRNPASATVTDSRKKRGAWLVLRRKCPCSGKKSVQVVEKRTEPKTSINPTATSITLDEMQNHRIMDHNRFTQITRPSTISPSPELRPFGDIVNTATTATGAAGFTFPILNQPSDLNRIRILAPPTIRVEEEPPRESLEVFRPLDHNAQANQRKMSRKQIGPNFLSSPKSRDDDDVASDASSDLFEIESFSTQTTTSNPSYQTLYNTNSQRDSLDEVSHLDVNQRLRGGLYCRNSLDEAAYEPSEASIDWSVTTAEAASVTNYSGGSEFDEKIGMRNIVFNKNNGGGNGDGRRKSGGNGLLSCRSEKAVSVGPHPPKWSPEGQRELRHVGSRVHKNTDKPPLPKPRSTTLSHPFPA